MVAAGAAAGDPAPHPDPGHAKTRSAAPGPPSGDSGASVGRAAAAGGPAVPLTSREREVLQILARGRQNKEIASDLFVSLNTVKKHLTHILDKLGVTTLTPAADRARELGLLS